MDKRNVLDMYELTPMQKGMLFHTIKDNRENVYIVQGSAVLEGGVDPLLLEKSFNIMIDRYDVLRTAFLHEKMNRPLQVVLKQRPAELKQADISGLSEEEKAHFLETYKKEDRNKPFNLSKDVLIRLHLIQLASSRYELIWSFHHMIMDGWCWSLVFEELMSVYVKLFKNEPLAEDQVPAAKYSSYIKWLQQQDTAKEMQYWSEYLEGYEESAAIPRQVKGSGQEYTHREHIFKLDRSVTDNIVQLSKSLHTTTNCFIQAVWGLLLQKYSRKDDVVFGSVVSGRPPELRDAERMVGLFINTIPVRVKKDAQTTFRSLVEKVHHGLLESKAFEYSSLADIQANSECEGQLVNHILVFENYASTMDSVKDICQEAGFTFHEGSSDEHNSYDLSIIVQPQAEMEFNITYNEAAYTIPFIKSMSRHFCYILKQVLNAPDRNINDIQIMDEAEKRQMMGAHLPVDFPRDMTLNTLFEEQVNIGPDRVALVHGRQIMTYRELQEASNRLARFILRQGLSSERIVGLLAGRSFEMIVGILAILKSGATYLPIDPSYPDERITYTLDDSGAALLIAENRADVPEGYTGKVISLDEGEWKAESKEDLGENFNKPDDVAYIIYTSGSTGKPKGVMVEHKNVVRLLFNSDNLFDFSDSDVWTMFHSMCFDFSVWEMYGALLYGGKLVIVPGETARDARQFRALLLREQVTVLNQTPSSFHMLSEVEATHEDRLSVRKVIFGGEALYPVQLKEWNDKYPGTLLINMYGITETTVHVTYKEITREEICSNVSNIGRTIPTLTAYVLDENQHMLPIGVPGELHVSGEGVARGCLNRPELTRERFIENPFEPGQRMYRSGDLVKWLPNMEMEYLGRIDHQVKIRGHRIELDEVNSTLLLYPEVKEGIVLAKKDQEGLHYLAAYYVAGRRCDPDALREYMAKTLPQYMIPSFFVELEQMPITANGKIKRDALPDPAASRRESEDYAEPSSELEFTLLKMYQDVLGIAHIGMNDHFLRLGGHSLKATMLVSRIQKLLEIDVPVSEVLLNPTIKQMAHFIAGKGNAKIAASIRPAALSTYYPATSQQRSIYSVQQFDQTEVSYNIPLAFEIQGSLDVDKWKRSIHALTERHESLRTFFELVDGQPVQKISQPAPVDIPYIDIESNGDDLEETYRHFIKPFSLDQAPLFRAALVKMDADRHVFLWDIHHIVCDGISIHILLQDLFQLYHDMSLPMISIQYKDFAVWQKEWRTSPNYRQQEQFWLDRFADSLPVLDLPADYPRPPLQTFEGSQLNFELDKELTGKLRELALREQATLFMTLIAAYDILLARYSGQNDLVVGIPLSGRQSEQLNQTVGMFANVVPLRNRLDYNQTCSDHLQTVKSELLNVYQNGDYPLEDLIAKLSIPRNPSRNPLFDTLFAFQGADEVDMSASGLSVKEIRFQDNAAKFDMSWEVHAGETLQIQLSYNNKLYRKDRIERLSGHFKRILSVMADDPDVTIGKMNMLSDDEMQEILHRFNHDTSEAVHRNSTIIDLFEEQVRKTPELTAVKWREQALTYRELNDKANRLATVIRGKALTANRIVGIMISPSLDMVVSIMGILKAGAAYLPIDPSYPSDRVTYMLSDSQTQLLLVNQDTLNAADDYRQDVEILDLASIDLRLVPYEENAANPAPEDLAYIIYTSGSTGKPKGVMIEHRSVCNLSLVSPDLGIEEGSKVLQFSSLSFDASVWEIFTTLLSGASLYIEDKTVLLEYGLGQWMREQGINTVTLPPSLLRTMPYEDIAELKTIVTAGEACTADIVDKWSAGRAFINAYGPTEGTVCASISRVNKDSATISIGKPNQNVEIYILNEIGQIQPVGVPGELYIGGEGVARAYLNRPELTSEKFIANPFNTAKRLYRTGDLAQWLPSGEIEYLGRIDNQVKIRGYRIEIGEVTDCLLRHQDVQEAVIIPVSNDNGSTSLAAYYVLANTCTSDLLRKHLKQELPEYMVPSYFVRMDSLPLTSNGKIDVKNLPKPTAHKGEKTGPANEEEALLLQIWKEVLASEEIGTEDHFFELGGDSIKAIQISAKLSSLNYKLKIIDLFTNPTIRELALKLTRKQDRDREINERIVTGPIPLTPIQHWVYQLAGNPSHWNQAVMLQHEERWDEAAIASSFERITLHHDALRMVFIPKNNEISQEILEWNGHHFDFEIFDFQNDQDAAVKIEEETNRLQRSINLGTGPLIKLGLFRTDSEDHLLIIIHHLVIDAVSWRIILEDFAALYDAIRKKQEITLPAKSTSFKAWSEELTRYANSMDVLEQSHYWENISKTDVLRLPADVEDGGEEHTFGDMKEIELVFSAEETKSLLTQAPAAYKTEINDLLLVALATTIRDWTGHRKIAVDVEGHGRREVTGDIDLTRTVGWFTTFFPVVYHLPEADIASSITSVQQTHKEVPDKGMAYCILKFLTDPQYTADFENGLSPEILFNYLGQFEEGVQRDDFYSSPMSTGDLIKQDMRWPYQLELDGHILNGQLKCSFRYNERRISFSLAHHLAAQYKNNLSAIVAHCIQKKLVNI